MAAQPLVRRSYTEPRLTIETNVMGTVHLLEALRDVPTPRSRSSSPATRYMKTTNSELAFAENAPLGGRDPYSASKAATEILTRSYAYSFFAAPQHSCACARAGNVIGGGDWAADRLIPDLWRAYSHRRPRHSALSRCGPAMAACARSRLWATCFISSIY